MTSGDRHAEITTTQHGPLVNIASWILMCMSVLFTAFHLVSSLILRGTAGKDDLFVIAATALAASQVVATSMMVTHGLGQHQSSLQPAGIESYQKALLASSVLYVAALALSRLSVLYFLGRLVSLPQKRFRALMGNTLIAVIIYLVVEILCLSFACNLPASWDYIHGQCVDLVAFWIFDTVFDVTTSIAIIALPVVIVSPLRMSTGRKFKAISAFVFQIPLCTFAIVRLVFLYRALKSSDQTWNSVNWQIWTQINLHFSIVAANTPCLNIFLEGFQSVLFRQDVGASVISLTHLRSNPYSKNSKGKEKEGRHSISGSARGILAHSSDGSAGKIYKTTEWTVLNAGNNVRSEHNAKF